MPAEQCHLSPQRQPQPMDAVIIIFTGLLPAFLYDK
jgi:hypothetical protein